MSQKQESLKNRRYHHHHHHRSPGTWYTRSQQLAYPTNGNTILQFLVSDYLNKSDSEQQPILIIITNLTYLSNQRQGIVTITREHHYNYN